MKCLECDGTGLNQTKAGHCVKCKGAGEFERFVLDKDPDKPWRYFVKDNMCEFETRYFTWYRDAKRRHVQLVRSVE